MTTVLEFCTPAVPGETHKYYGLSHNKFIKLPLAMPTLTTATPVIVRQNRSQEQKTIRSVALAGNLPLFKKFLQIVPDPLKAVNDAHPATGWTCLHFAASRGHLNIVQLLIEEFAVRVDSVDKEGETALLKAAYNGHYSVVHYLLESNANLHHKDKDGWTALHNACSRGYFRIARLLIERNAKVDVKSKMGHTPLSKAPFDDEFNAASKGYMSIVEYLLDEGHANPLLKNNFGEAAYDVSAAAGESYICELLERAGRKWWHLQRTEGILNPSNKRASMFGATYDLQEFHVTMIVILHENERSTSLLGLSRPQFSENYLTKSDARGPWSLHPTGEPKTKEMVSLPETVTHNHRISTLSHWFWLTDWDIDYSNPRVDPTSGWQYARSFDDEEALWTPVAPTSGYAWVRRRRWVRVMKRRMDLTKGSHHGEHIAMLDSEEEEEEEEEPDYLFEAETIVQSVHSDIPDAEAEKLLKENMDKYQEAIVVLSNALQGDENEFRKNQATTLIKSYMTQVEKISGQIETAISHGWSDWSSNGKNLWESDKHVKTCRACDKKFGFLLRRHHCRKCGTIVCDRCSSWKIFLKPNEILQDPQALPEPSDLLAARPQRVCEKCYSQRAVF
ncbi:ankyrin repeat-containing domain protein [Sporodiniella umbellata]|nr:ankyrin repeat-containing domain protein [Sporodiniella umbellata]